jgi:HmuY protein
MKQIMKGITMVFGIAIMASCSKNDPGMVVQPLTVKSVPDLVADTIIGIAPSGQPYGSGKYSFYSLENNSIVAVSDSNSNKWDLGFRGTSIITNSGNSGPANGGAFVYVGIFDDLKQIPVDSVFRADNAPTAYAITSGSNKGWYIYNSTANLVTPIPGRILVIRTANGKYAKLEILNYYKGGVTPATTDSDAEKLSKQRYYTFRYVLQPNGTTTFQ